MQINVNHIRPCKLGYDLIAAKIRVEQKFDNYWFYRRNWSIRFGKYGKGNGDGNFFLYYLVFGNNKQINF